LLHPCKPRPQKIARLGSQHNLVPSLKSCRLTEQDTRQEPEDECLVIQGDGQRPEKKKLVSYYKYSLSLMLSQDKKTLDFPQNFFKKGKLQKGIRAAHRFFGMAHFVKSAYPDP
jgi:hypothetical protein